MLQQALFLHSKHIIVHSRNKSIRCRERKRSGFSAGKTVQKEVYGCEPSKHHSPVAVLGESAQSGGLDAILNTYAVELILAFVALQASRGFQRKRSTVA